MAIKTDDELKEYFQTGKFPTQQQFADLIESKRSRGENIGMAVVTGLLAELNNRELKKKQWRGYVQQFGGVFSTEEDGNTTGVNSPIPSGSGGELELQFNGFTVMPTKTRVEFTNYNGSQSVLDFASYAAGNSVNVQIITFTPGTIETAPNLLKGYLTVTFI